MTIFKILSIALFTHRNSLQLGGLTGGLGGRVIPPLFGARSLKVTPAALTSPELPPPEDYVVVTTDAGTTSHEVPPIFSHIGVVLRKKGTGDFIVAFSEDIGEVPDSQVAETKGILKAMDFCVIENYKNVKILSDCANAVGSIKSTRSSSNLAAADVVAEIKVLIPGNFDYITMMEIKKFQNHLAHGIADEGFSVDAKHPNGRFTYNAVEELPKKLQDRLEDDRKFFKDF